MSVSDRRYVIRRDAEAPHVILGVRIEQAGADPIELPGVRNIRVSHELNAAPILQVDLVAVRIDYENVQTRCGFIDARRGHDDRCTSTVLVDGHYCKRHRDLLDDHEAFAPIREQIEREVDGTLRATLDPAALARDGLTSFDVKVVLPSDQAESWSPETRERLERAAAKAVTAVLDTA